MNLPWVEMLEVYLLDTGGSRLVVEDCDAAPQWIAFFSGIIVITELSKPDFAGVFIGNSLGLYTRKL
jgi:hypothetical protein